MSGRNRIAAVAAGLAILAAIVWWSTRTVGGGRASNAPEAVRSAAPDSDEAADVALLDPALEAPLAERSAIEASALAPQAAPPAAPELAAALRRGRVQDTDSRPVAGIDVYRELRSDPPESRTPLAVTDASGAFTWTESRWGALLAESDELTTVLPAFENRRVAVIVVAPRRSYSGIVVDELGLRLADVELVAQTDDGVARQFLPGEERGSARRWTTTSGADGAFVLDGVGWTEGLAVVATLHGFEAASEALPERSSSALEIQLRRPQAGEGSVSGTVVDLLGLGVEGATVGFERGSPVSSDADGRFVAPLPEGATSAVLWAGKKGRVPAQLRFDDLARDANAPPREPVTLVLGGEPPTIAGRVLDREGLPVAQAYVFTRDMTPWGRGQFVESLSTDQPFAGQVRTDAEGRFRFAGLLPKPYTLRALHPRTLEVAGREAVEAGTQDVVLRLDGSELARRVAGRVVDCDGRPVPGVRLFCGRASSPGIESLRSPLVVESTPVTDELGAFEFPALCVDGAYLLPVGGGIAIQERIPLDPAADLERLTLTVSRICRFQVVLESNPDEADRFFVLDGHDARMNLSLNLGDMMIGGDGAFDLAGGRSEIMQGDQRAKTLVLQKAGVEVRRIPIQLAPGELALLRL